VKGSLTTNILILCTHNSARSVLAEAMLNHWAKKLRRDVQAFSAGSSPSGRINPHALQVLEAAGVSPAGYHSKSWDEFSSGSAPQMRAVVAYRMLQLLQLPLQDLADPELRRALTDISNS
jgi:arsenate reductase